MTLLSTDCHSNTKIYIDRGVPKTKVCLYRRIQDQLPCTTTVNRSDWSIIQEATTQHRFLYRSARNTQSSSEFNGKHASFTGFLKVKSIIYTTELWIHLTMLGVFLLPSWLLVPVSKLTTLRTEASQFIACVIILGSSNRLCRVTIASVQSCNEWQALLTNPR